MNNIYLLTGKSNDESFEMSFAAIIIAKNEKKAIKTFTHSSLDKETIKYLFVGTSELEEQILLLTND